MCTGKPFATRCITIAQGQTEGVENVCVLEGISSLTGPQGLF
jgi:hypothetical protein